MKMDHCGFQVRDMDKAIRFYTEKLSFRLDFRTINQEQQEEYAFVSLGEARLELIRDLVNEYQIQEIKKPYCPHFCIEVQDMEIALRELKAKGVTIVKGPLKIENEETWVYFSDEDNNVLEYIQWYNKK
jgi:catechol 2,3-dioxygenase-like lactoylglutathione lyase family enzyme